MWLFMRSFHLSQHDCFGTVLYGIITKNSLCYVIIRVPTASVSIRLLWQGTVVRYIHSVVASIGSVFSLSFISSSNALMRSARLLFSLRAIVTVITDTESEARAQQKAAMINPITLGSFQASMTSWSVSILQVCGCTRLCLRTMLEGQWYCARIRKWRLDRCGNV